MIGNLKKRLKRWLRTRSSNRALAGVNKEERGLIFDIRDKRITYLSERKLASIVERCKAIETAGLPGLFIEAGCALGGSTVLIASIKNSARPLWVYDVFDMIPPPSEQDTPDVHQRYETISAGQSKGIKGDEYYGYMDDLYGVVVGNLESFGIDLDGQSVQLIKGLLQDTMHIEQEVAFAHIDVDWYEPVITSLRRIFPHLVVGGSIVLDDYHDWGGCKKATDEYLQEIPGQYTLDDSAGSLSITKTKG